MDKNINEAQEQCTIHSVMGSALFQIINFQKYNIMSDGISDMNLAIEAFRSYLTQSMEQWGAKYELQYSDYSENQCINE